MVRMNGLGSLLGVSCLNCLDPERNPKLKNHKVLAEGGGEGYLKGLRTRLRLTTYHQRKLISYQDAKENYKAGVTN